MTNKPMRHVFVWATGMITVVSFVAMGIHSLALAAWPPPEQKKITCGLPGTGTSFFPNYAASERGFYKEEGFDEVKILAFKGGASLAQAMAAGTVDFCVGSPHVLVNTIKSGQRFKAFWAGYTMTFFEWYAQPKYKSLTDAKGGRFGVSRYGSLTDSLTRYILKKAGLEPEKDVKILQSGQNATILAALESGQLDVGILESLFCYEAREKGLRRLASQREDIAPDYPSHVLYAKEEWIAKNPNTIKAYLRATGRAMEWIKANNEDAAKLLSKVTKIKYEYSLPTLKDHEYGWHPDGRLPKEGMKVFWEITVSIGDAKEPWPNEKWLDDTFLKTQNQWRK